MVISSYLFTHFNYNLLVVIQIIFIIALGSVIKNCF